MADFMISKLLLTVVSIAVITGCGSSSKKGKSDAPSQDEVKAEVGGEEPKAMQSARKPAVAVVSKKAQVAKPVVSQAAVNKPEVDKPAVEQPSQCDIVEVADVDAAPVEKSKLSKGQYDLAAQKVDLGEEAQSFCQSLNEAAVKCGHITADQSEGLALEGAALVFETANNVGSKLVGVAPCALVYSSALSIK